MPAFAGRLVQLLLREHPAITLAVVLGLAAVYLLLPRPRPYPTLWGAAAGAAALFVTGGWLVRAAALTPEALLFYAFSAIAVIAGALLVTQRNPARAALAFALVVISTCGLFLLLAAPFLTVATIIIYAGAIVVTFLFVIMLAQQEGPSNADQRSREPFLSSLAGFLLLGALLYALAATYEDRLDARLRRLQEFQARLATFPREPAPADKRAQQFAEELHQFLEAFRKGEGGIPPAGVLGGKKLYEALVDADDALAKVQNALEDCEPVQWQPVEEALAAATAAGLQERTRPGALPPSTPAPAEGLPLSPLSGPAPNQEPRRDAQGRPEMPAENVAYLGRSLFSDYLIAVELAGTLLLVATIGAIAIAGRRAEGQA